MKKMNYSFHRMQKDFGVSELADAAAFTLAENKAYEKQETEDQILSLKSSYLEEKKNGQWVRPEAVLDLESGNLMSTRCNCEQFQKDTYSCKHVAGLLLRHVIDLEGVSCMEHTRVEEELIRKTGIATPLVPGILRKTDRSLSGLLKKKKGSGGKLASPSWLSEETFDPSQTSASGTLSLEVVVSGAEKNLKVELKSGTRRRVVIHNMDQFLNCYRSGSVFTFSNTIKAPVLRTQFEEADRQILDFLARMSQCYNRDVLFSYDYAVSANDRYRQMELKGRDLDAFFQLMNGKKLQYQQGGMGARNCTVKLEQTPSPIRLQKEQFGASLLPGNQQPLACGMDQMYLADQDVILALPVSEWDKRNQLSRASANEEPLYVAEQDLPALCQSLTELKDPEMVVAASGFALGDYLKEVPEILLYLDYPQEDMISCEMKAVYHKLNKTFPIFDQRQSKTMRNLAVEQAAGEQVVPFFTAFDQESKQLIFSCDENNLYRFLTETLPQLSQFGEVLVSDRMKKLKVRPVGELTVGLSVDAGGLLMSLQARELDKEEIAEILSSYNGRRKFTRLKNGEFIIMPEGEQSELWDTLAETYRAYGQKNPEAMKLPLFRALYLKESLEERDSVSLEESDTYHQLIRQLSDQETWQAEVPESLRDVLREYQKDGYRWIRMLKKNGFGGILADDMGLGKTIQVLAFLLAEKQERPAELGPEKTLIVAPASLIYNWKKEIHTFTPELSCQVIAGTVKERKTIISSIADSDTDIYVTSYDLLKRDFALYETVHFDNQVIDEAQYIKNQNTQVAKAVRILNADFHMALTGTPIENRLSELWSIFDYLMPGFLYSYSRFRQDFEAPVINDHDEDVMERLRRMVHPFILRRMKKDVLMNLPDKLEELVSVRLEGEQRKLYDAFSERLRLYLDKQSDEEFHHSKLEILAELTRLRQVCCGPGLFLEKYKGGNAKKDACMELIHRAIDGGHKILLFSQFTSVLDEMGKALTGEKIAFHRIDGSVRKEDRMRMVEAFDHDEVPVFCISLKAGGTGLNLTAADIVIHYDPWWNLAAQNQATDRAHRIGQTNAVTVYQLIAEDTIEEQITRLQQSKAQLAQDILEGEGIASIMIRKEDLMDLL